jgi:hypothetical protein
VIRRLLQKQGLAHRQSHLAVIVLPDEMSAFQAYRLLNYHGISPEHVAIVGTGYSSPERIGLLRPIQIAFRKAVFWGFLAGVLGLVAGIALELLCHTRISELIDLNPRLLLIPLLGGICLTIGAVTGWFVGIFGEGTAASIFRHHLNRGHYLLMIEGSEQLVRWGQEVLGHYSVSRLY